MGRPHFTPHAATLCLLLISAVAPQAGADSPAKRFPGFAARKDSLGPIALVADILVVETAKPGEIRRVWLGDCPLLGNKFLSEMADGLKAKGYAVQTKELMSLGLLGTPDSTLSAGSLWDGRVIEGDDLPRVTAPFHVDSTLCPDRQAAGNWFVAIITATLAEKKKNQTIEPVPGTATLRELAGSDHLMLMRIVHNRAAKVNKGLGLLGFHRESYLGLDVAIVDARNGELLWQDHHSLLLNNDPPIKDGDVASFVKHVLKPVPDRTATP